MKLRLTLMLLALAALSGCASGFGYDAPASGQSADAERTTAVEAPGPRRHQGSLARGGVYDN